MLLRNLLRVQRTGAHPDKISFEEVTVTDWLWILRSRRRDRSRPALTCSGGPLPSRWKIKKPSPTRRNASSKCRAAIVDSACSWRTKEKYCGRFMDARDFRELLPAFASMGLGPEFNHNDVSSPVIRAQERICGHILPLPLQAGSPNSNYMAQRDPNYKEILDTFVLQIIEHHDLRRRATDHAPPAKRSEADRCRPTTLGADTRTCRHHSASEGLRLTSGGNETHDHRVA